MLPYTPLHALLLHAVGRPLVCTSGNFSDEPICTDDGEALRSLSGVADLLLTHDRPIVRPVDDSVARVGPRGLEVLRRARGFAPRPLPFPDGPPLVALGAQLKGTVTLALRGRAVVSQHLGDLHSARGARLLERTARELVRLFDVRPALVACDLHPDYASTRLAERLALEWEAPLVRVQHHHAHVAAVMAEHAVAGPVLGLAWDGAGLGTDGDLWGGEALSCDGARAVRVAHLRPFSLPGGERAIREPRRAAFGALFVLDKIDRAPFVSDGERALFATAIARGVNAPRTTSVGRLFDAVAALVGLRARAGYEGQAAMELEWAADAAGAEAGAYELPLTDAAGDGDGAAAVGDWEPLVLAILDDRARGVPPGVIAARFHGALVEYARACARRAGLPRVVLSGGCFQNARLSRLVRAALEDDGFEVLAPRRYPPNDGAVSLGQALVAAASWTAREGDDVSRRTR
jgi:hydrogenase maturation protein HypF